MYVCMYVCMYVYTYICTYISCGESPHQCYTQGLVYAVGEHKLYLVGVRGALVCTGTGSYRWEQVETEYAGYLIMQ